MDMDVMDLEDRKEQMEISYRLWLKDAREADRLDWQVFMRRAASCKRSAKRAGKKILAAGGKLL